MLGICASPRLIPRSTTGEPVPGKQRRYPRHPRQPRPELKPLGSKQAATQALRTRWRRTPREIELMVLAAKVGRGIFNAKENRAVAAQFERMLAAIERIKSTYPTLWPLVVLEEPRPFWWGIGGGLPLLLKTLKGKRRTRLAEAVGALTLADLKKKTLAQVVTVAVTATSVVAGMKPPGGTELAALAVLAEIEPPTGDAHAQRQRPDSWSNCLKTCRALVDEMLVPVEYEVRVFPDDFDGV